jgi:hypothetical protein
MLAIHIAHAGDPLADAARELEPGPLDPAYDRASLFFVAVGDGIEGMIRVIQDSPAGLKTLNDLGAGPLMGVDPFFTWDVVSVIHRDDEVGFGLYSAFLREALRQGVYASIAALPPAAVDRLNATYGPIFRPLAGLEPTQGLQPVSMRMRQVPAVLAGNPPLHRRIVLATGFARPVSFPGRRELAPALR